MFDQTMLALYSDEEICPGCLRDKELVEKGAQREGALFPVQVTSYWQNNERRHHNWELPGIPSHDRGLTFLSIRCKAWELFPDRFITREEKFATIQWGRR